MIKTSHGPQPADLYSVGMLLIVLLLWLLAVPAWAVTAKAGTAPPPAPAEKPATGPQVYGVTEVIPRSERSLARLHEIRQKIAADTSIDLIDRTLSQSNEWLEEWWNRERPTLKESRSVQRVNDLAWDLGKRYAQVEAWKELLNNSGKTWIAEAQALERGQESWQATRAALRADTPPAVRIRVDEVLREINAVQQLYRETTARLIASQSRLAAYDNNLQRIRVEFETSRIHSARGLFAHDSRTLWTLIFTTPATQPLASEVAAGWSRLTADFAQVFEAARPDAILHVAAFLGILGLMLLLRWYSGQINALQPTVAEQSIINRSVFSSLLLVLSSLPLVYPELSPRVTRLVVLPALVPMLVLAPAIITRRFHPALYFFLIIFLLDFLRNYVSPQWPSARLLLLAVSVLGAAGLFMLLRRTQWQTSVNSRFHGTFKLFCVACAALFLGSALANMTGNISLAEFLVSPLIRLTFLAIAIRIGVVVTTTFGVLLIRTPVALLSRIISQHGEAAALVVRWIVGWTGIVTWIYLAFFNLGMLAAMQESIMAVMKSEWEVGAVVISMRGLITFFVVLLASYLLSRLLRLILAEEIFPRISFPRGVPDALVLLARYGVLLFGFLLALSSAGVDLSQVTIALSALGVGIGFGLQGVVNNFVCGLILVFEHPIQVGDYIEVGPHYGQVTRIGFRASIVTTRDGSEVVIPNSELIGNKVVNWSLSDSIRRLSIPVAVSYGTDTALAMDILQAVARNCPQVCANPPPSVVLDQFGESNRKFLMHCWVRTEQMKSVQNELTLAVDKAFREAGIEMPNPQADVHLHFPEQPQIRVVAPETTK